MRLRRKTTAGTSEPAKRMIAAGRKIDGVWQVKTFLRGAADAPALTFWETVRTPATATRRRRAH